MLITILGQQTLSTIFRSLEIFSFCKCQVLYSGLTIKVDPQLTRQSSFFPGNWAWNQGRPGMEPREKTGQDRYARYQFAGRSRAIDRALEKCPLAKCDNLLEKHISPQSSPQSSLRVRGDSSAACLFHGPPGMQTNGRGQTSREAGSSPPSRVRGTRCAARTALVREIDPKRSHLNR